jgi:hypothetical protein
MRFIYRTAGRSKMRFLPTTRSYFAMLASQWRNRFAVASEPRQ